MPLSILLVYAASLVQYEIIPIAYSDLFKPEAGGRKRVLIEGDAGIGKTM
jgi:hypothetical protein